LKESERTRLEAIKEKAVSIFRPGRPILIGTVSMELKSVSLREAEMLLEMLTEEGLIRLLTKEECRSFGIQHGYWKD
jgi:hypothetical protein